MNEKPDLYNLLDIPRDRAGAGAMASEAYIKLAEDFHAAVKRFKGLNARFNDYARNYMDFRDGGIQRAKDDFNRSNGGMANLLARLHSRKFRREAEKHLAAFVSSERLFQEAIPTIVTFEKLGEGFRKVIKEPLAFAFKFDAAETTQTLNDIEKRLRRHETVLSYMNQYRDVVAGRSNRIPDRTAKDLGL